MKSRDEWWDLWLRVEGDIARFNVVLNPSSNFVQSATVIASLSHSKNGEMAKAVLKSLAINADQQELSHPFWLRTLLDHEVLA